MANNIVFAMGTLFLLNYYTDVAGMESTAIGTMLLGVRIFDAVMDLVAGSIADRTMTRFGRFRPFLLWGALPLVVLNVLVFSVPAAWSSSHKLVYAYGTYALLGVAYSFVNIPYGSLATVMTQQSDERTRLGAARMLFAACSFCILAMVIGPQLRGAAADLQYMYTKYTICLGSVAVCLYFICFMATIEPISCKRRQVSILKDLRSLTLNRPLFLFCLCSLCIMSAIICENTSIIFYTRYVLGGHEHFIAIIAGTSLLGPFAAVPLASVCSTYIGKKRTFLLGCGVGCVGSLTLFLIPSDNAALIYCAFGVAAIGPIFALTVMWAMEADTVEYGEWVTGIRMEGLTYALFSFTRKCGQAIGGSIPAYLLACGGYVPNLVQDDMARLAILSSVALVPAGMLALAFALMLFYPLTDERHGQLLREIEARRLGA